MNAKLSMHLPPITRAVHAILPRRVSSSILVAASLLTASSGATAQAGSSTSQTVEVVTEAVIAIKQGDGEVIIAQANVPVPPIPPSPPSSTAPGQRIQRIEAFNMSGGQDIDVIVSSALSEAFSAIGAGGAGGAIGVRTLKNAPYSAEIINERIQSLPDGNQIVKRTSQMSYRDSAGRTRNEARGENGETRSITIFDAVDNTRLVLSPQSKTATKISFDRDFSKHIEAVREKAKAAMKDLRATIVGRGGPGEEIVIHRSEGPRGSGTEIREEVSVKVIRGEGADAKKTSAIEFPRTPHPSISGPAGDLSGRLTPLGNLFQDRAWSSKATTKELGTKDIEGIRAEGKLRSYTIPAGEVGNKNAITVTTETWTSPELQLTVYSKHSDPRVGDTIYRLTNLKRAEPSLSLFTAPDGYTVKETPSISFKAK
jgi:hypothetical protein